MPLCGQYAPPLRGPLLVTGTFGELRSDHFHAGLDFRAAVGTPVYSVADGYVSRIKISAGGYGQAIYIDHPDGRRSVYGHLEALAPALHDTVRRLQYQRESFALDFTPKPNSFPVVRGQEIGEVGNRGFSFGPHLHFELRDSTDAPLNPLALGFAVADTRPPQLRKLRVYALGDRDAPVAITEYALSDGDLPDTIRVASGRVGLGLSAFDRQNAMPNRNGIYAASVTVAGRQTFAFRYDRIPFDRTEYLNALTDFAAWKQSSSWYYLLYTRTREALFWTDDRELGDGIIDMRPGEARSVTIAVSDYAGNTVERDFVLCFSEDVSPASPPEPYVYVAPEGRASVVDTGGMRLELPATALYDETLLNYVRLPDGSAGQYSDSHLLHDTNTPLHGRAQLTLPATRTVPDSLRERSYIGRCTQDGKYVSMGGHWAGDRMVTTISSFGTYAIRVDTLAPTVRIERFGTDQRGSQSFSVLVEEEAGGGIRYRGEVDGRWVLLEHHAKSGQLRHTYVPGEIGSGMHTFTLTVSDRRGNERRFTRRFRR